METSSGGYCLFFDFIEKYLPDGFQSIDTGSSYMLDLESSVSASNQFFFIADQIQLKVLYASKNCKAFLGIESTDIEPASFLKSIHPGDLNRLLLVRTKIFQIGGEILVAKKGISLISTTLRFLSSSGDHINQLVQCYLFYTDFPFASIFRLQVHTDISGFNKTRHGFHYYVGDDLSYFRYPDEKLLMTGNNFSMREFEIIKMVSEGLNSEQIGKKLFRSVHTIDTHRRNILKKSKKSSIMDLILDLKNKGLL
jgi:hypothetical protein